MCRLVSIYVLCVYVLINLVQPEILQDSSYGTHKYITANGIKFHYVANGTEGKPLMLFIHGFSEVSWNLTAILKLTISVAVMLLKIRFSKI